MLEYVELLTVLLTLRGLELMEGFVFSETETLTINWWRSVSTLA